MKFARDFRESLASQDFPPHWIEYAIPYGQLKKCLKKVQRELQDLGLDAETLRSLSDPENTTPIALKYRLNSKSQLCVYRGYPLSIPVNYCPRSFVPDQCH